MRVDLIEPPFFELWGQLDVDTRNLGWDLLSALENLDPEAEPWRLDGARPIDDDSYEIDIAGGWVLEYRLLIEGLLIHKLRRVEVNLRHARTPLEVQIGVST
jgi:hypothetical protein